MTNYYVSNAGNDSNDGLSTSFPWKTINKVNGETFSAGDNIYWKAGDTFNDDTLAPPNSGSSGNVITFSSYDSGSNPVIDATTSRDHAMDINGADYLTFDGIDFHGTSGDPGADVVRVENADYISFTNCTFDGFQQNGGKGSCIRLGTSSNGSKCTNITFDTCTIQDAATQAVNVLGAATYGAGCDDVTFTNCTFTRTRVMTDNGISSHLTWLGNGGNNCLIENCTFSSSWDFDGNHVNFKGGTGHQVNNCLFTNGTTASFTYVQNPDSGGTPPSVTFNDCVWDASDHPRAFFSIDDNPTVVVNRGKMYGGGQQSSTSWGRITVGTQTLTGYDITFNACAFHLQSGKLSPRIFNISNDGDVTFDNCTFLQENGTTAIIRARNTYSGTITIRNCILDGDNVLLLDSEVADPFTLSNNLYERNDQTTNWFDINGTLYDESDVPGTYGGSNSVTGDPLFSSTDPTSTNYFVINDTSPAHQAGSASYSPATDLAGDAYGTPPNIGARAQQLTGNFPTTSAPTESNFSTGASSHDVSLPSVAENDLLILGFVARAAAGITTPTGWTEKWKDETAPRAAIYVKKATGSEGSTVTVNVDGTPAAVAHVYKITAASWTQDLNDVEVGTAASGSSTSPDPPSLTASWGSDDNLWIAFSFAADDDETVSSYPSGYSGGVDTISGAGTNSGATIGSARKENTTATEDPGTFTLSASEGWHAQTLVVRPVGSVAVSPNDGLHSHSSENTMYPLLAIGVNDSFHAFEGAKIGLNKVSIFGELTEEFDPEYTFLCEIQPFKIDN